MSATLTLHGKQFSITGDVTSTPHTISRIVCDIPVLTSEGSTIREFSLALDSSEGLLPTPDLSDILEVGNITDGYDIVISSGDKIQAEDAASGSGLDGPPLILRPGAGDGVGGWGALQLSEDGNARGEAAVDLQIGTSGSYVASGDFSFIGAGRRNVASGAYSVIGSGHDNIVSGDYSGIGSGENHEITGEASFIGNGHQHYISGVGSVVFGGNANYIYSDYSTISGGSHNRIESDATYSAILPGEDNYIAGSFGFSLLSTSYQCYISGGGYSAIISGWRSHISDDSGFIGPGWYNELNGGRYGFIGAGAGNEINSSNHYNVIVGGFYNFLSGRGSVIGAGERNEIGTGPGYGSLHSFIGAGLRNYIGPSGRRCFIGTGTDNTVNGGTYYSFIGNGINNEVSDDRHFDFIGSGSNNEIAAGGYSKGYAAIVNGKNNYAAGDYSFIGSGKDNRCERGTIDYAYACVIGGGYQNYTEGWTNVTAGGAQNVHGYNAAEYVGAGLSVIGGGSNNHIYNWWATIAGGDANYVWANGGSILGGWDNHIYYGSGYSVVGGRNNKAYGYASIIFGGYNTAQDFGSYSVLAGKGHYVDQAYSQAFGRDNDLQYGTVANKGRYNISAGRHNYLYGGRCNAVFGGHSSQSAQGNRIYDESAAYNIVAGTDNALGYRGLNNQHNAVFGTGHDVDGGELFIACDRVDIQNSYDVAAMGRVLTLDNCLFSLVTGNENTVENTYGSSISGRDLYVDYVNYTLAAGRDHYIYNTGYSMVTGRLNRIDGGDYNAVFGNNHTVYGEYSWLQGTQNYTDAAAWMTTIMGQQSYAYGNVNILFGDRLFGNSDYQFGMGKLVDLYGNYTVGWGRWAKTTVAYQHAWGVGKDVAIPGDTFWDALGQSQISRYPVSINTTDATTTNMTPQTTIRVGTSARFKGSVIAHQYDGVAGSTGDTASWDFDVTVKRISTGALSIVGSTVSMVHNDAAAAGWTVALAASTNDLVVQVTGEVDKSILWTAFLEGPETGPQI
nr:hypothetical protein 41 [bacterium]